jgi:hypothetical protein
MNFNQAKIISVYYNKGDRKPYDVNGKPIAYIGEEFIGSTEATTIRFYLGEEIDSSTALITTKRADGEVRLDFCSKVGTGVNSYYEVTLNGWYSAVKGKAVVVFKAYNGTVTLNEDGDEILSATGRIVVSDIFNLNVAYAPNATIGVPPDDPDPEVNWYFALSTKLDKADSITVAGALPTLTGDVYDDRYFYVENEGVGRLFYINGSTAEEVVFGVGTLKLTATGNGELTADTGKISWDEGFGGFEYIQYRDVSNHIGQDVEYYGKAFGAITKGDVVQFHDVQGNHFLIKKAIPSQINANPKLIMGIAKQTLTNNEFGYVAHFGRIRGINTDAYDEGDFLWFASGGSTDGALTTTQPTAPNAKVLLAVVVDKANNGTILVRPTIEPKLEELQNVLITSATSGNVLSYDGTKWVNSTRLTTAETDIANIEDGTTIVGKALGDQNGNTINTTYLTIANGATTYVPLSSKGVANGVVPLNSEGKISSSFLSGEQDDFIEFANLGAFPVVGESDIIYCAIDTGLIYRWTGSTYSNLSPSLALGTTNTTAFPGDRGLATETQSNNIVSGTQTLTNTRITNSAVGTSPLIVNGIALTTANLQEWKINNSNLSTLTSAGYFRATGLLNLTTGSNSRLDMGNNGTLIQRDVNDLTNINPALTINQIQGLGDILRLQSAGANVLEITRTGGLNQNGTRLFHQTAANTNTLFGTLSGSLSQTATSNSGFGYASLGSLTSGQGNTAVGRNAGLSTTSGDTNTFVGRDAGNSGAWGTQLATANNSAGIGNQAYTDKSNQMVYGNASVTEHVFNRNTGAVLLAPQITASSGTEHLLERNTSVVNALQRVSTIRHTTSGDMIDGFGGNFAFEIKDNANVNNTIASFGAGRSGADNSGRLIFNTTNAGSSSEKMTILPDGKVGIGTSAPARLLDVNGSGVFRSTLFLGETENRGYLSWDADIFQVVGRVNQGLSLGSNNVTNRLLLTSAGLVGINETSPSAQLHVKSGATTRVPLIVDTLANPTVNIQEWRVNGSAVGLVASDGLARFPRLSNLATVNNAQLELTNNGSIISRNVADSNPALITNLANSSATGNIQVWQKAGSALAFIDNVGRLRTNLGIANAGNATQGVVYTLTTGVKVERNVADANSALIVNQQNAGSTGKIVSFEFNGVEKSYIDKDGNFSGASVQPTYTSLGSRAGSAGDGTITVTDITTYDELIVDLVYDGGTNGRSFRTQAPVSTHFQPGGAGDLNGITVLGVIKGGTTLVSATVSQNTNTLLDVDFGGTVTDYVVYVYGVNW